MLLATAAFDRQTVLPGIRVSSAPSDGRQRSCSESPASLLGKRDVEGVVKRPYSNSRTASRFRGVTHHCRTSRFESHIWEEGKQVYLGGFYVEEQAAMAYDLAAIRFRGSDAVTNFELESYPELPDAELVTREQVVHCLRDQSKGMNRLETYGSISGPQTIPFEPWELAISECIQQEKWEHLGVYGGEVDAARAYDRAAIQSKGIEALTNFPLVDYITMLDVSQVEEAVARGLLPPTLPSDFIPPPLPLHLFNATQASQARTLPTLALHASHCDHEGPKSPVCASCCSHASSINNGTCHSGGETPVVGHSGYRDQCSHLATQVPQVEPIAAPAASAPGPAACMATPRSVMDFQAVLIQALQQEAQHGIGGKIAVGVNIPNVAQRGK